MKSLNHDIAYRASSLPERNHSASNKKHKHTQEDREGGWEKYEQPQF